MSGPSCRSSYLLATLGLITLMLAVNIDESIGNEKPQDNWRGGRVLSNRYGLLNKWVVVFRRYEQVADYTKELGSRLLGYGIYFRSDGWMLANMGSALEGSKMMEDGRMNMTGWFIHDKENDHRLNTIAAISPYHMVLDHAMTYPGPNVGIFRSYLTDYEEVFRVPPYGQPAWTIVYPMRAWIPEIATKKDQRNSCYVFIHDQSEDSTIGGYINKPLSWRFWAIRRKGSCKGPICQFEPHEERNAPYEEYNSNNHIKQAGQICDRLQDRGAPIMCHTNDIKLSENGTTTLTDRGVWKLAYTVVAPVFPKTHVNFERVCSRIFTAFDLSWARPMLLDTTLESFVPDHYKPHVNPSE